MQWPYRSCPSSSWYPHIWSSYGRWICVHICRESIVKVTYKTRSRSVGSSASAEWDSTADQFKQTQKWSFSPCFLLVLAWLAFCLSVPYWFATEDWKEYLEPERARMSLSSYNFHLSLLLRRIQSLHGLPSAAARIWSEKATRPSSTFFDRSFVLLAQLPWFWTDWFLKENFLFPLLPLSPTLLPSTTISFTNLIANF